MPEVNDLDTRTAMLQELSIMQGLDEIQLLQLATSAEVISLEEGESPLHPDTYDDRFFVVTAGKIRTTFARGRRPPYASIVRTGDFFGAEKILYGQTSLASAVALEPCTLIAIAAIRLKEMLQEIPLLKQNLKASFEFYRLRQNKHYAWLEEDEKVVLFTRKHRLVLLISLLKPLGVAWAGMLFLGLGTLIHAITFQVMLDWIGFGLMGLALLWALWRTWLWTSEYYIVTDRRVVFQQVFRGLYDSRIEIPMTMLMPPKLTQSRYERIMGFGDVFSVTDRTPFDYRVYIHVDFLDIPFPERVQELIEQYRRQASSVIRTEEDAVLESVLMHYLEPQVNEENPATPEETPSSGESQPVKKISVYRRIINTFKTRLETDGTITYRKHWLELLRRVWLPTLTSLLVLAGVVFLLEQRITNHIHFPSVLILIGIGLIAYILPVVWWVYQVLDWRNDIYQLVDDKLLDIERQPFVGKMYSRPTLLSKIRSLDFERNGVLGKVFNSGDIYIGTADDKLIFDTVHEPDRVLREVFYRVYELRQKVTAAEIRTQQDSTARMMLAYYRQTNPGRRL